MNFLCTVNLWLTSSEKRMKNCGKMDAGATTFINQNMLKSIGLWKNMGVI